MSKIGKKPIAIPTGVSASVSGDLIKLTGPKGSLERKFSRGISVELVNAEIIIKMVSGTKTGNAALWGLERALIANMVKGVSVGFSKTLEFSGVGYKAQVKGNDLHLNLGFTNPVIVSAPQGISFAVDKNTITVSGYDRELVGNIAAQIKRSRPPEPYKGTGIKYAGEIIKRKAGKKAVASAA